MAGRPTLYSDELANEICVRIATNPKSLRTICKADDMPDVATVMRWVYENEQFREHYARAKQEQSDMLIEEMMDAAYDEGDDEKPFVGGNHIQRDRLKVDTLKWIASKLKPKKYGDKLDVTSDGEKLQQEIIVKGQKFAGNKPE